MCQANKKQKQKSGHHHSTSKSAVKRWNTDVIKINKMFESGTYINPFKISDLSAELVHFATGTVSTPDIQKSLVDVLNKGKAMADTFVKEPLMFNEEQQTPKKELL